MSEPKQVPDPHWRCFHCGEVFTEWGEAHSHFGDTELDVALCVEPLRGNEEALLQDRREWRLRAFHAERHLGETHDALHAVDMQLSYLEPRFPTVHALARQYIELQLRVKQLDDERLRLLKLFVEQGLQELYDGAREHPELELSCDEMIAHLSKS